MALGISRHARGTPQLHPTTMARRDRARRAHAASACRAGFRRHVAILPLSVAAAARRAGHLRGPATAAAPHAVLAAPGATWRADQAGRPGRRAAALRPAVPADEPAA